MAAANTFRSFGPKTDFVYHGQFFGHVEIANSFLSLMKLSRILLFTLVLFGSQVAVGAIITLILGVPITRGHVLGGYVAAALVSICVFAYMTWDCPIKPFLNAFTVGASAYVLGVFSAALIAGEAIWDPIILVFDAPALLVTVLVGVSLGTKFSRRGTAK